MSTNDAKPLINGAYSLKYKLLEQERLRRLQLEHKDCSKLLRERAIQLSKQTKLRRRALEEKKEAMAKAEEERRKKALEERRRQQKEATERFRTAISRQTKPAKSISFEMICLPQKHANHRGKPTPPAPSTPPTPSASSPPTALTINRKRVAIGKDVEVPSLIMSSIYSPQQLQNQPEVTASIPNLEDVLETIRGKISDHTPSMESIVLSPEPLTNQIQEPTEDVGNCHTSSIVDELSVASDSSNSTLSLHDSIDSSIDLEVQQTMTSSNKPALINSSSTVASTAEISDNSTAPEVQQIITTCNKSLVISTAKVSSSSTVEISGYSSTASDIQQTTTKPLVNTSTTSTKPLVNTSTTSTNGPAAQEDNESVTSSESFIAKDNTSPVVEEPAANTMHKKGILKKYDTSSDTMATGGTSGLRDNSAASSKRVRFCETIEDHHYIKSRRMELGVPRMKISVGKRVSSHHQILASNITKINRAGSNGLRNGIVIHIPPSTKHKSSSTEDSRRANNTITLPYPHSHYNSSSRNSEDTIDNLWTQINRIVSDDGSVNITTAAHEKHKSSSGIHHQQVKLWKRHQQTLSKQHHHTYPPAVSTNGGDSVVSTVSNEEQRLMESIELINNKLQTLPINVPYSNPASLPSTSNYEHHHQPLLVRTQSPNQLLHNSRLTRNNKQLSIMHRTLTN